MRRDVTTTAIGVLVVLLAVAVVAASILASTDREELPPNCERHTELSHYASVPIVTGKTTTMMMQPIYTTSVVCHS